MITISTTSQSSNQQPFLAKLYLALFFQKIGLGDLNAARQYIVEAIKLSPTLIGQLEKIIPDWAMQQTFGSPLILAQIVLNNLPGNLAKTGRLQERVLGKIHIAQAFVDYKLGDNPAARQHLFKGIRYSPITLKNRGVLTILAKSFLNNRNADLKTASTSVDFDKNIPKAVASSIAATINSPLDYSERIPSKRRIYLVQVGEQEYILRIHDTKDILKQKLALINQVRAVGVPAPAPVFSSLSVPAEGHSSEWLLEEKVPGLGFGPRLMSEANQFSIIADLGRYLRRLHRIKVTGFGPILSANLEAPYSTFAAWLGSKQEAITKACLVADIPLSALHTLDMACRFLQQSYLGPPILCHCEITDSNILTTDGRINGIIDWDSATGADPAYDIAIFIATMSRYWYPTQDCSRLAALIEAYQPDEPDNFYRRVVAHRFLFTAEAMTWAMHDGDEQYHLLRSFLSNTFLSAQVQTYFPMSTLERRT